MNSFDFKKIKKRDIIFSAIIILLTAFMLLIPSRIGGKGTSPGMSALNAIILTGKLTEITYEKHEPEVITSLFEALSLDRDIEGCSFWNNFIKIRYGK